MKIGFGKALKQQKGPIAKTKSIEFARTFENKRFAAEGCQNRTLGDLESKLFEDMVLNGSACKLNRAKTDFEYPSAAKY